MADTVPGRKPLLDDTPVSAPLLPTSYQLDRKFFTTDKHRSDESDSISIGDKDWSSTWNNLTVIYVFVSIAFLVTQITAIPGSANVSLYQVCDESQTQSGSHLAIFRDLFSRRGVVDVTLCWGNLSFATAKWIDLIWDIGFGRAGQLVVAWVSYRVITRVVLHSMKETAVPHSVLAGMSFSGVSAATLFRLLILSPNTPFWKAFKGRLLAIAFIITYAIVFPTLTSAMTGYTTAAGHLIGIDPSNTKIFGIDPIFIYANELKAVKFKTDDQGLCAGPCHMWLNETHVGMLENDWKSLELRTLNSSGTADGRYILFRFACEKVQYWENNNDCDGFSRPSVEFMDMDYTPQDPVYAYVDGKKVFSFSEAQEMAQCQATGRYHWGFSFQILFVFSILNLLWAIAISMLWHASDGEYGERSQYGTYRAAVDIVQVAKEVIGDRIYKLSDGDIRKELDSKAVGIWMSDGDSSAVERRDYYHEWPRSRRAWC